MSEKDFAIQALTDSIKLIGGPTSAMGSALKNVRAQIRKNQWKGAEEDYKFIKNAFDSNEIDIEIDFGIKSSDIASIKDSLKLAEKQLKVIKDEEAKMARADAKDREVIDKYQNPERVDFDAAGKEYEEKKKALPSDWKSYVEKTSDKENAKLIWDYWSEIAGNEKFGGGPGMPGNYTKKWSSWVKWYNDVRKAENAMKLIGKQAGDHLSPTNVVDLLKQIGHGAAAAGALEETRKRRTRRRSRR